MYGICHTSNVRSTRIGHASSVFAPEGGLENGMIVEIGDIAIGETDIRDVKAVTPAEIEGKRISLISSPEIIPGEDTMANRMLGAFHIEKGGVGDAYDLVLGDEFEISDNLITLGVGVSDLSKVKYLTTKEMKYEGLDKLPETGVVLKVNRIFDATVSKMFNKTLAYKLVHVTVERI